MPNTKVFRGNFVSGEMSPEMFGRIDDPKFQSGAASIQNMISTALGPCEKRPGFEFVNTTKNNGPARLIPFTYSITQTLVIELGVGYARFHTQGETLLYAPASVSAWIPGDASVTYTLTTPTVIGWPNHGLVNGNAVSFYVSSNGALPSGLQLAYGYTVKVIDANTFNILDASGNLVAFGGGSSSGTNYPATSNTSASLFCGPGSSSNTNSIPAGGLSNTATSGSTTLLLNIVSVVNAHGGTGEVEYQYSTDGVDWYGVHTSQTSESVAVSAQISASNLDLIQVRVYLAGNGGPSGSVNLSGAINSWSVTTGGVFVGAMATLGAYRDYASGQMASFGGFDYVAITGSGGTAQPGTNPSIWYALPADLIYEIPTPYAAADLMDIHYVQSADVVTLTHQNYPPAELRRLGATEWQFASIVFGQTLAAPTNVTIVPTLGYKAVIGSVTNSSATNYVGQALFMTDANHNLAMGDGVYVESVAQFTGLNGFYLVSEVPADSAGNLIPNELYLMDYSGNPVMFGTPASNTVDGTLQYGTQIIDITNTYVVAAVASDGIQQSPASAPVSVLNNLYVTGSYNTISWTASPNAYVYYVYKLMNGLYGYIGETSATSLSFSDTNIAADMSITPDIYDPLFTTDYPAAVGYYQQRRCFGGTPDLPQNFWMTKTGTESDMTYSLPIRSTDRIAISIASREMSTILHVIPLLELILLTSSCEISLSPQLSTTLTPSTIGAIPQSYIGSTSVQPSIVNNTLVFCAARGGHVRQMAYAWQVGGYVTSDVSSRAAHLFDGFSILDQALMMAAWQVVWHVSSSGNLLGFTYIPEEGVAAWHHHITAGTFQSIAAVAEGAEDRLYAVITRQINGQTVNCIERMGARLYGANGNVAANPQDAFYVDCGATFDGTNTSSTTMTISGGTTWGPSDTLTVTASVASFVSTDPGSVIVFTGLNGILYRFTVKQYVSPTVVIGVVDQTVPAGTPTSSSTSSTSPTTSVVAISTSMPSGLQNTATAAWAWARPVFTGLTWLVGETVNVLVDGAVQPSCVVSPTGQITIQRPGVVVQVGLPYTAEIETLPTTLQTPGFGQGTQKNINKLWVKLYISGSFFAGPTNGALTEYKQRTTETYGAPPALITDEIELAIAGRWDPDGSITISQSNPLPLTVVGITAEVSIGG